MSRRAYHQEVVKVIREDRNFPPQALALNILKAIDYANISPYDLVIACRDAGLSAEAYDELCLAMLDLRRDAWYRKHKHGGKQARKKAGQERGRKKGETD